MGVVSALRGEPAPAAPCEVMERSAAAGADGLRLQQLKEDGVTVKM